MPAVTMVDMLCSFRMAHRVPAYSTGTRKSPRPADSQSRFQSAARTEGARAAAREFFV
jgi:hypothetical protein